jgi:hypothetical protein
MAVLARFPGAQIVDVRKADAAPPSEPPIEDDAGGYGADERPDDADDEF